MSFKSYVWPLVLAWSLSGAAALGAQSLAEVARQEEARRKEIRQPSKVYTNKDLAAVPPPSVPPAASAPSEKPATPPLAEAKDGAKEPAAEIDKSTVKDQKYWSGRLQDLLTRLDREQTFAEALQSRINALSADFTARDDPAQRAVIGRDRQKAIDELARLKQDIQASRKAIADFEEEARRASVPPGWLR